MFTGLVQVLGEVVETCEEPSGRRLTVRWPGLDTAAEGPVVLGESVAVNGCCLTVVELAAGRAHAREFDAVLIPGGYAPDRMRMRHAMTDLVRDMLAANKPVAAIDRGAQLLISVKAVAGRTITCWPSIAIDIKNAGGRYVDRPVVEDNGVITARKADDVPHFAAAILKALGNLQPAS